MINIDVYSRGYNTIGESPVWSSAEQALYWIDIGRKRIYRRDSSEQRPQSWILTDYPGCLAELPPGSIAVAMREGVYEINLLSGAMELLCAAPARRPSTRFNDGKVDPRGRLWVGTMQNNFAPNGALVLVDRFDGALYRFAADGRVDIIEEQIGIPNTLAWSPDLTRFYFGDSLTRAIFAYDFDAESGSVRNKRTFYDGSRIGIPDGSAIDIDGCLWNARWDGGAVLKITPEGKVDQIITLPVIRPTSCCFGGSDLRTLFVTSATNGLTAAQLEEYPFSGSVFAIHGVGQGVPVPPMILKRQ